MVSACQGPGRRLLLLGPRALFPNTRETFYCSGFYFNTELECLCTPLPFYSLRLCRASPTAKWVVWGTGSHPRQVEGFRVSEGGKAGTRTQIRVWFGFSAWDLWRS